MGGREGGSKGGGETDKALMTLLETLDLAIPDSPPDLSVKCVRHFKMGFRDLQLKKS